MTTEVDIKDETDILIQEMSVEEEEVEFEYADCINDEYLDTLWGDVIAIAERDPAAWKKEAYLDVVADFLNEAYSDCLSDDDKDEEIWDQDQYIHILQSALFAVVRQLDVAVGGLTGSMANLHVMRERLDIIPMDDSMPRRMLAYAFTGLETAPLTQQRFFTDADFKKCLYVYDFLPPELQKRAGLFIEAYSANMSGSEHSGQLLAGTILPGKA